MQWVVDPHDAETVEEQLGRKPRGLYRVVARDASGIPSVIQNYPRLLDGTPMPTTYWLTSRQLIHAVGTLESAGGVDEAEADVDEKAIEELHVRYAQERDALLESHDRYTPMPSGGVAGTRRGVKCLHAHLAYLLAGHADPVGEWVRQRIARPLAAVDCGTNSTRLLIWDEVTHSVLYSDLVITRLGVGVDTTGKLSGAAIERTVAALREYKALLAKHKVKRVRAVATSATRDAENGSDFLALGSEAFGHTLDVISGSEEGALAFSGAAINAPCMVVDIGGGSTELVFGRAGKPEAIESLQMGAVRLTERFLANDPPMTGECADLRDYVRSQLHNSCVIPQARGATVVAVAGTATSIAAISLDLDRYMPGRTHRHIVSADDLTRLGRKLAAMSSEERVAWNPAFLPAGRAEVIVAGAILLGEILIAANASHYVTSELDILYGMIRTLFSTP